MLSNACVMIANVVTTRGGNHEWQLANQAVVVFSLLLQHIRRLMEKHFQSALKIGSDADKAKVWEKVQRMERQYHDYFFSGCPRQRLRAPYQCLRLCDRGAGPDAGPRERRSPSASPPYIPHASSQAMKTTQLKGLEQ